MRFPSSRHYVTGDGTLPDCPAVAVWHRGEWVETFVRSQQWLAPLGDEEKVPLAHDWWVHVRVRGRGLWFRANDVDWGDDDSAECPVTWAQTGDSDPE